MKDFYQRLKIAPYAEEATVRAALADADPPSREAAEFVLLDPKRRRIYDRDHRLLTMIGELRMHLGLNYTRFWARQEYRDFWRELMPAQEPVGRRVDAMMIARAFGAVGRHGRRHVRKPLNWLILVAVVAVAMALFLVCRAIWGRG
jgi:hypothetical protein